MDAKLGLLEETIYDPEKHGEDEWCEEGDRYYVLDPAIEALTKTDDLGMLIEQGKQSSMCKCIERINKQLEQYNTSLTQVSMLNMKTGKCRQSLTIGTQRRLRTPKRTKVKIVLPTFCPFCGKRSAPKAA